MERRDFVFRAGAILVIAPAARFLQACGDDGGGTNPPGGPAASDTDPPEGPTVSVLTFTSTAQLGHTHRFQLNVAELNAPSPEGLSRPTSVDEGHTHVVVLTESELEEIAAGAPVTKVTTVVNDHTHSFVFTRTG